MGYFFWERTEDWDKNKEFEQMDESHFRAATQPKKQRNLFHLKIIWHTYGAIVFMLRPSWRLKIVAIYKKNVLETDANKIKRSYVKAVVSHINLYEKKFSEKTNLHEFLMRWIPQGFYDVHPKCSPAPAMRRWTYTCDWGPIY